MIYIIITETLPKNWLIEFVRPDYFFLSHSEITISFDMNES